MAAPSNVDDRGIELTKELRDPYGVFYDEDVLAPVPDVQPLSSLEEFADKYMRDKKAVVQAETTPRVQREVQQQQQPEDEPQEQRGGNVRRGPRAVASVVERSTMGGMHTQGPLSILFRAVRDRLRVKVWTRSHTRVRSILTGFVHAYDRHLNLALADVDEVLLLPPAPSLPTATGDANEKKTATETTTSAPAAPLPTQVVHQQQLQDEEEEEDGKEIKTSASTGKPIELWLPAWAIPSGRTIPEKDAHPSACPTPSATASCDSSEERPRQRCPRRKAVCIPLERLDVQPESGQEEPSDPPSDPRPLAAERTAVVAQKRPARTGRIRRRAAAPTLAPRSRHVNQLFVRGDNVVSVALMPV
ncbi:U7 snRNA-associated Sm-like protein LSm11 [Rhipicephalus sanguineus]|uniref:U7 snRNA-associated Sm-like protein LSm11 n=1 Tax=Rhipicephalus sanguineus TaxID=34632 RepID=UPI0020C278FE|nr:U7 snRNA-associated Sm-like protein LSm11 [Rhipicephalus sanguineus]